MSLDWDDLDSRRRFSVSRAYYRTKLAQCMYTIEAFGRLTGLRVNAIRVPAVQISNERLPKIHPFLLWIYEQKQKQSLRPEQMAQVYAWLALDPEAATLDGAHVDEHCKTLGWPSKAKAQDARERLWQVSTEQAGLEPGWEG